MKNNSKYLILLGIISLLAGGSIGLNINLVGIFLTPIANDLGFLTGDIAIHSTLNSVGVAVASLITPPIAKKMDFRLMVLIATAIVALATVGLAFSTELWHFYLLALIRGSAATFYGMVPLSMFINNWFHKSHGLVTSIVFSFSGIVGAIFSPILTTIIEFEGWRTAYVYKAIFFVLMSLPAILYPFKFSPYMENKLAYGEEMVDLEEEVIVKKGPSNFSFGSISFISILIAAIIMPALSGFAQHLPTFANSLGFNANVGALMLSLCMIGNILSKLVIGFISDRKNAVFASVTMTMITGIGLAGLFFNQIPGFSIIGSFLYGFVYSVVTVGFQLLTRHIFEPEAFDRVFPILSFVSNLGAAFALSIYGYSYDFAGSYQLSIGVSIVVIVITVMLILIANQFKKVKQV